MKGLPICVTALVLFTITSTSSLGWSSESGIYSFGVVPQFEQRKLFRIWRPILNELERRTGLTFNLKGSSKIPVFEHKYIEGAYDFAYMNPYHMLKAHDSQGYLPLVRDGGRMLKGILVVSKDSPIKSVQELAGKHVAFPAPNALGASLLIRADLMNLYGVQVSPHYVQTHSSVYLHVALDQYIAGGGVTSTLNAQKPEIRQKLRIIYETRPMNPHPISVHPRVSEAHWRRVLKALLEMGQTEKGAALLAKIPMHKVVAAQLDDYTPISSWGLDEFYTPLNNAQQSNQSMGGDAGRALRLQEKTPVSSQ
ncbi:MAG: phosphate/phosphite/phosphonate ABC transporter substrate-binding protein [Candidatus Thiodiazotropha sp.]|jgi:phosphonate transport system substrate-binding protein